MRKILYLTNIEVPYRVRFFNELAKYCDLTVVYEREKSGSRNDQWAKSEKSAYCARFLNGIKIGKEHSFSFRIIKEIFGKYDRIIVGCYNSPIQIMAILIMRLFRIPYIINLDGEPFLEGNGIKQNIKRFVLSGAAVYLVAGESAAESLRRAIDTISPIIPYYFSSLSEQEIQEHRSKSGKCKRNETVLVVGQYADYKGMDVALEAARMDKSIQYKFVGMGSRTEQFRKDYDVPDNVEIIPFLQKNELEKEYQSCAMLVLPSRKECWGLVINEAASFGTPIVSTWGSGVAVEFLLDKYPQYMSKPSDPECLLRCIQRFMHADDKEMYRSFLLEKSKGYTIERSIQAHIKAMDLV